MPDILMVTTSQQKSAYEPGPYGLWLDDFIVPYYLFCQAGFAVTVASPAGGAPLVMPARRSFLHAARDRQRFSRDWHAQNLLNDSLRLEQIYVGDFNGVFYVGGPGALGDLQLNPDSSRLILAAVSQGIPLALAGHAVSALSEIRLADQRWLVQDQAIAVISEADEWLMDVTSHRAGSLAVGMSQQGAKVIQKKPYEINVVVENKFMTGQNAVSTPFLAECLISKINI